jgi:hypothetical protein
LPKCGCSMSVVNPLTASGSRDPDKRPRPVPKQVRDVIVLMVRGHPDDPDKSLDFIEAGKLCGIKPDVMRRWLDRVEVRSLLRAERRAWRMAICAGNESALRKVRDNSANGMVVVNAVRTLEQVDEEHARAATGVQPGLVIVIGAARTPPPEPVTIDVKPIPEPRTLWLNGYDEPQPEGYFKHPFARRE